MATVKFFTRTKRKANIHTPIYVRLRSGRSIDKTVNTGYLVSPEHWSNKTGRVRNIAEAEGKDDLNSKLRELSTYILNSLPPEKTIPDNWLEKTVKEFKNPKKKSKKSNDKQIKLFAFIEDFIAKAPTRPNPKTGRPVCYKMIREYERTFHYLKDFANQNRRRIDFKDIDLDFYHDFMSYLTNLGLAANTIGKKIQTLKIFLNAASDTGANSYTAYKSHRFTTIKEETESAHLNEDELVEMFKLDLSNNKRLEKVRDLFLIGAWTGLRFSDWNQVSPENIHDGLISIKQSKTGGKIWIPVHPMVEFILNKYDGELPAVPTNQRVNEYIKEVAKAAKITTPFKKTITKGGQPETNVYKKWEVVSSHTARRSFATNAYNAGVPSLSIMAITGHKTESSFLKYIKVTPKEHALKLQNFWKSSANADLFKTA